ncbi:CHAT domain-containing protein [Bradyrhizobium sp. RT10b]|uniref:CHAT domain-containing protein n=1 Tax=Bradyrhizobium sp. RT10b TaxID=3156331 RepID=UPI00339B0298
MRTNLSSLAKLVLDLDQKSKSVDKARRLIEGLEVYSIEAVEGERWLVAELEQKREQARAHIEKISVSTSRDTVVTAVEELKEILGDVGWELLGDVKAELERKTAEQEGRLRTYNEALAKWRPYLNNLRRDLTVARNDGIPLINEERSLLRLDGLIASLDRAVQEKNFIKAPDYVQELDKSGRPDNLQSDQIERQVNEKRNYALQADLLILRPPLNETQKVYEYTILLRTPSRPGSHGVNIQGTSTIVEADRNRLTSQFAVVTAALNRLPARKAELLEAGTEATVPISENAVRDLYLFPGKSEPSLTNPNALLREIGDFMFRIFIPEQIAQFLKTQPCSLTLTTNDLELPWELMLIDVGLSESKFFCLERPVARLPMGYVSPRFDFTKPASRDKKRFLFICSDPDKNLPGASREIQMIRESLLERWKEDVETELIHPGDATGDKMNEILRGNRFDVIHYAGHASFNSKKPDLSALMLSDREPLFAQKIRRLLKGRPLVVLNACRSAMTSNPQSGPEVQYELQEAEGLAAAFIYGGALGCLGAIWPVFDDPAAEFAIAFYNKVLEGEMIGLAVRHARQEVQKAHTDGITWASFALYGDPTFRVFS